MVKNGVIFRKTHDLTELIERLEDNGLPQPENRDALDDLGPFAVTARYDFFDEPISFNRRQAVETACFVRDWAQALL